MELTSINSDDLSLNDLIQKSSENSLNEESSENNIQSLEENLSFSQLLEKAENGEISKEEDKEEETEDPEDKNKEGSQEDKVKEQQRLTIANKLDDSTKNAISKLIETGEIEGFEDGKIETISDFQELIRANKEEWREKTYQEVEKTFYENKSPIWQAILQYAEDNKNPKDVLDLLSEVNNYQEITNISLDTPENQEYVISSALALQGLTPEIIKAEIEDLKDRNKLEERAKILKPALEKYNQEVIEQRLQEKALEDQQSQIFWQNHINNVVKEILEPVDIDGIKIKKEDRQLIAQNLIPDPRTGGLPIFNLINNLLEQGDFKTLAQITLMANDKKKFNNYYSNKVSSTITTDLQRKLRTSKTSESTSPIEDSRQQTGLKRSPFNNNTRFINNL